MTCPILRYVKTCLAVVFLVGQCDESSHSSFVKFGKHFHDGLNRLMTGMYGCTVRVLFPSVFILTTHQGMKA